MRAATVLLLLALLGCGAETPELAPEVTPELEDPAPSGPEATALPAPLSCPSVVSLEALGRIQNSDLTETSGLAVSNLDPAVLWAVDDSGGEAALYALGRDGSDLGVHGVPGVVNRDWEDLAAWADPLDGTSWLYVGDIGDNLDQWDSIFVHRMPEPALSDALDIPPEKLETFELAYPDGPQNAEALLVGGSTGTITIITKGKQGEAQVFEARGATPGSVSPLTLVGTLDLSTTLDGQVTAADSNDQYVFIRTYTAVLAYGDATGSWWESEPCVLEPPFEIQGEALATEPDGSGYFTVSEGRAARLNRSGLS